MNKVIYNKKDKTAKLQSNTIVLALLVLGCVVSNVTSGSDETPASSSSALGAPENQDEGCRVVNMAAEVILEFDERQDTHTQHYTLQLEII